MNHAFRRPQNLLALVLISASTLALATASSAAGATAGLVKVGGKPTLALTGAKGEANSVNLRMVTKTEFVLEDNGEMSNHDEVVIGLSGDSMPGCQLEDPYAALNDPANLRVRCRLSAVKRVLLDLRGGDDYVTTGDGYRKSTEVPRSLFVRAGTGADQVIGGPRRDVIQLGAGGDIGEGRGGNDSISGGSGSDSIRGDEDYTLDRPPRKGGNDVLAGGPGNDYIAPGSGRDVVKGGPGRDIVSSVTDRDRDYVDCGAGRNDSLLGLDSRGIRFAERFVAGCETVGSGTFGGITWSCRKRRCKANVSPFAARLEG